MKKVGIGVLAGLALFAVESAKAVPQETGVLIPYFSSTRGMFTAVTYVFSNAEAATPATEPGVHIVYYYKPDLTQNLADACNHYDGLVTTSEADVDTFLVVGADNVRPVFSDGGAGDEGTIVAPPVTGEGFLAIQGWDFAANAAAGAIAAEAHVVVTATRGVFSFRGITLETDDAGNINLTDDDTLAPGTDSTTVMMFPEAIAETYLYAIADGGNVFAPVNYNQLTALGINPAVNGMGIFGRAENGRSGGQEVTFNCAAVIHAKDILGDAHYTFLKDTGGWFSLRVPEGYVNNAMVYKLEISAEYGSTITPLTLQSYGR